MKPKTSQTEDIKVSIVCISYNHEKYIKRALEGFAMQKVDFRVEIIIGDDASTDRTQEIISEFKASHKMDITAVLRKSNIGVNKNLFDLLNRAKGEYIALCEGDDYWTDPLKIARQVALMDSKPAYALCFHPVHIVEDEKVTAEIYPKSITQEELTKTGLLKRNLMQTSSVMYRNMGPYKLVEDILPLDYYLHLHHAKHGEIGFIHDAMSIYRHHAGGIWQDKSKVWNNYKEKHLKMYHEIAKLYPEEEYRAIIDDDIDQAIENIIWYASNDKFSVDKVLDKYGEDFRSHVTIHRKNKRTIQELENNNSQLISDLLSKNSEVSRLRREVSMYRGSRSYRVGRTVTKPLRGARRVKRLAHSRRSQYKIRRVISRAIKQVYGITLSYRLPQKPSVLLIVQDNNHPTSSTFIRSISLFGVLSAFTKRMITLKTVGGKSPKLARNTRVVVVQRTALENKKTAIDLVNHAKARGIKIYVDTDDAFNVIDKKHPEYEEYTARVEALDYVISNADEVWFSTEHLKRSYGKKNGVVVRNTVDPSVWSRLNSKTVKLVDMDAPLEMVYMGTKTHASDLNMIMPALEKLHEAHPGEFRLHIIGVAPGLGDLPWMTQHNSPDVLYPNFVKWFNTLPPFDIGLSPLEDTDFNRNKSDIKCLDYLAVGAKPVVSDVEAYANPELDELIVRARNSTESWYDILEKEIQQRKENRIAASERIIRGYKYLLDERSPKNVAGVIDKAIKEAMKNS